MHNGAALAIRGDGRLIGTAVQGGAQGGGTLFELFGGAAISAGQVLVPFPGNKPGPITPFVAPTFGSDFVGIDNIFGTTITGGDDSA